VGEATHRIEGSFADLGVDERLLKGLESMGYSGPTPVQKACWEPGSEGQDLLVQSKTGSGKTTAFGLPLLARVLDQKPQPKQPLALILGPTRELVKQVARELTGLAEGSDVEVVTCYGGVSFGPQEAAFKRGARVVVATPGRLLDHLRRGNFNLDACRTVCLDEADEMLSMGFWEEVTSILKRLPRERQIMLFSATLPERIQRASSQFMDQPKHVDLGGEVRTVMGVTHRLYPQNTAMSQTRNLLHMLEAVAPTNAIVFCNRRMEVDLVANFLRRQFWNCTPIHGDMPQKARERALESVRGGRSRLLIATDVAARGIDIRGLDAVFHFDLPQDAELYVHRAGRTGRIGASGLSAVLLTRSGGIKTQAIKARYAVTFEEANMPDKETSVAAQAERVIADLTAAGADLPLEQFMDLAQGISESPDAAQAIAYLLFEQTKRQKSTSSRDRDRKRDQEPSPRTGSGLTRYIIDGYEGDEAPEVTPIAEALGLDAAIVTVEASRRGGWLANIPRDTEAPGRAELTLGEFEVAIRRMKPPGRDRQRRRR